MATLAVVVAIASAGAAVVGGISAIQQGRFQNKIAKQNADLARAAGEKNARLALGQSRAEEARKRREGLRRLGLTRAIIAARGITVEGSPLDLLAEEAAVIEEDALLIRFGGEVQAQSLLFGAAVSAREQLISGRLASARGIGQGIALFGAAGASLLGGFGAAGSTTATPGIVPDLQSGGFALA